VEIRGLRPTFCAPYQSTANPSVANFSLALHQAIAALNDGSADLAGISLCAACLRVLSHIPKRHSRSFDTLVTRFAVFLVVRSHWLSG